jgi:hypothetical protein
MARMGLEVSSVQFQEKDGSARGSGFFIGRDPCAFASLRPCQVRFAVFKIAASAANAFPKVRLLGCD